MALVLNIMKIKKNFMKGILKIMFIMVGVKCKIKKSRLNMKENLLKGKKKVMVSGNTKETIMKVHGKEISLMAQVL